MSFFNRSAAPFPMMLPRAQIDKDDEPSAVRINVTEDNTMALSGLDNQISMNPSPSFDTVRACYEHFVARQPKHESSQYIRTLSGTFTLFLNLSFTILRTLTSIGLIAAVDATMKFANKASVYSRTINGKMQVVNPFAGGLLTGVNEDKELVFWEFLPNDFPSEMQGPLLEFAERYQLLGQNFGGLGEVVVDRCCDFRRRIREALPEVSVVQDFYHVKERIMRTLPANSNRRSALSVGLTRAIVSSWANKKGNPAQYRAIEEQLTRMNDLRNHFMSTPFATPVFRSTFDIQAKHVRGGCLQRRHRHLLSHTSGNENWHKRLGDLVRGMASSLTTIQDLLADGILRYNVKVDIYNLSQPADSPSRQFRAALASSHHVFVMNNLLRQRETLYGVPQPLLLNVAPHHRFGLVPRQPPGEFDGDPEKRYQFLKENLMTIHEKHRGDEEEDKDGIGGQLSVDEDRLFLGVDLNGDADVLVDPESLIPPDPRTPSPRKRSAHTAS
ncbi:hypothetical protein I315_05692 [Cryptococcus gattii Ru294]|nr:hypothetical protein I315_05692 [Cryptococcus gattii Ru294]